MLERYAVKVARTVLRGGSGSNATPLPDQEVSSKKVKRRSRNKKAVRRLHALSRFLFAVFGIEQPFSCCMTDYGTEFAMNTLSNRRILWMSSTYFVRTSAGPSA